MLVFLGMFLGGLSAVWAQEPDSLRGEVQVSEPLERSQSSPQSLSLEGLRERMQKLSPLERFRFQKKLRELRKSSRTLPSADDLIFTPGEQSVRQLHRGWRQNLKQNREETEERARLLRQRKRMEMMRCLHMPRFLLNSFLIRNSTEVENL
jgi:hypothetical protein